ncbi:ATP12 family chaperone protein [Celeribacter persicus]|jgi:Chaperone required for the assembly of the mitochondrial F1-ATPase|uniref:Chaperone required for assembly of F1-ATPase n=1 Tax=Celeribacter persicus TaxID=1651082 RepID=A0A2T5HWQ1_9RHOB|nr:ATP12 family protein [Celeribacter persicus]PTQ76023.1 chaperone required for assembly of F1-ATPase [Celeribacter persicus]
MAEWAAKRFWKDTTVAEADGGFTVHLDGRPVRTPAKMPLIVPTRALADLIAAEWEAQEGAIDPNTMPATRGANAALDKVSVQHAEVADMLSDYGDSDLLCYRAEHPRELVERQATGWDPLLDWAAEVLAARLEPRAGVMHTPQSPEALETLRSRTHALTAFELAAFHDLVALSGSLILGFAVIEGRLSPEEAWALSRLDEQFQIEQWGEDEEATEAAEIKRQSFLQAALFYRVVN